MVNASWCVLFVWRWELAKKANAMRPFCMEKEPCESLPLHIIPDLCINPIAAFPCGTSGNVYPGYFCHSKIKTLQKY